MRFWLRVIGRTIAILVGIAVVGYIALSLAHGLDLEVDVPLAAALFIGGTFLSGMLAWDAFKSAKIGGGTGYAVRGPTARVMAAVILSGGLFAAYGMVRLVIEVGSGDVDLKPLAPGLFGCIGAYVVAGAIALLARQSE